MGGNGVRSMSSRSTAVALILLSLVPTALIAQEYAGKGLPALVEGNESFGLKLLARAHAAEPAKNIAISPISLTLIFAAIRGHAYYENNVYDEISRQFGWNDRLRLSIPARQFMAAFEEVPKAKPCP